MGLSNPKNLLREPDKQSSRLHSRLIGFIDYSINFAYLYFKSATVKSSVLFIVDFFRGSSRPGFIALNAIETFQETLMARGDCVPTTQSYNNGWESV